MNSVVVARRILVAEDLNAQETNDGRDAVAVEFQLFVIFVTQRIQIHFAALDEFIK